MPLETQAPISKLEGLNEAPTLDERRALLGRVASSVQLKRATRLREFLVYAGGEALKSEGAEIHEQEIGAKVFGRPFGYDTSQDNIVRVNASELRKRLEQYFAAEGLEESLILEIPRGSYKPVFRRRVEEPPPVSPSGRAVDSPESRLVGLAQDASLPEPVILSTKLTPSAHRRSTLYLVCAISLLAMACVALLFQNRSLQRQMFAWEGHPALTAFWPEFLHSHQNTDIVLADTSVALISDISKQPFTLSEYLNHGYRRLIDSADLSRDRRDDIRLIASRHNGSMGDFRVAQEIMHLDRVSPSLHLQFARDYTPDSIKRNNVILIGSSKSNPWVHLFDGKMNFTIEYDADRYQSFIANHNPAPGEQATYDAPVDPYASVGYSVIAFLPNPSRTGDAIVLAGTTSEATDAAGEFLTSEESLDRLRGILKTKSFPYFEVLLKTTHLSGTPFSAEIVALRQYPASN